MRRKIFIVVTALMLAAGFSADAFARAGGGGSFGSRGSRTFNAPPATTTAPRGGSSFERSMTPNQGQSRPNFGGQPSRGGLFSGIGGGLLGGLLGAGLIGMLFGHGFGGGLGGMMSFIGLLLQIGLLFLLVRFALNYFRNRRPAMQGATNGAPGGNPFGFNRDAPAQGGGAFGGLGGALGGAFGASAAQAKLDVAAGDFNIFERRLSEIQTAFSNEDMNALRSLSTPEMASYFAEELGENARKGVVNKLSNIEFLQGDLAEAWRELAGDYASVAMRFSMIDATYDRATGRLIGGDPSTPQQATEIWTFTRRPSAGPQDWRLSAIQQA